MYKNKDKQREAQRNWVRQKRIDKKGSTEQGLTIDGTMQDGYYEKVKNIKPKRGKDIRYQHQAHCNTPSHIKPFTKGVSCSCRQMTVMEQLFYRPASELGRGETNFVSLPGRACYNMFKRKARG